MDGIDTNHNEHGSSRSYSSVLVDPPTTVHLIDDVDDDEGSKPIGRHDGLLGDSILTENEDSYRTTMNKTRHSNTTTAIDNGHCSIDTTELAKGSMKKSNVLYGTPASASASAANNNNDKKFRTYHFQTIQEGQKFLGTEFTDRYRRVIDDDDYDADGDLHNSRHDDNVHGLISSFNNALDQFSHQYTNAIIDLAEQQPALTSSNDRSMASRTTRTKPASIMAQTPLAPTQFQLHSTPRHIESKARTTKGSATTVSSYMTVENNKLQASALGRGIGRRPQQYAWEQHLQDPTRSPPRPVETPLTAQRSTRRSMDTTTISRTTKDADDRNYKPFLAAEQPSMNKPSITDPSTIRNRSALHSNINRHEPGVKESSSLSAIIDELRWTIECQNIELDLLRHGGTTKHDSKLEATTNTYDPPFHDHSRDHYHDANGINNENLNHPLSNSPQKSRHRDHGSKRFGTNEKFVDEREGSYTDWNDKVRSPYNSSFPDGFLPYDAPSRRRSSSTKAVRNDFSIYEKGSNTTTTTATNNNHDVPTATDDHIFSPGTRHVANILRHMELDDDHFVPLTEIIDRHWNRRFEDVVDSTKKSQPV